MWRPRAVLFTAAIITGIAAACGSGPMSKVTGTVPAAGTVTWTVNGQTFTATEGPDATHLRAAAYQIGAADEGATFSFGIEGVIRPSGEICTITSRFVDSVPPPVGAYPVASAPAQATFDVDCSAGPAATTPPLRADAGLVTLTRSAAGDVEGTFEGEGVLVVPGAPKISIFGGFNVSCLGADLCGPYSAAALGTCEDLLTCCGNDYTCMTSAKLAMAHGDAACGRLLIVVRPTHCP